MLLARVRTLNRAHRARSRSATPSSMGSHLRFGFEATYGRDTVVMRDDNVADYPWLCFALVTVMQEYERRRQAQASTRRPTDRAADRSDPQRVDGRRARVHRPAAARRCQPHEADAAAFASAVHGRIARSARGVRALPARRRRVFAAGVLLQLLAQRLKGTVVDALLWGEPWDVSFERSADRRPARRGRRHRRSSCWPRR